MAFSTIRSVPVLLLAERLQLLIARALGPNPLVHPVVVSSWKDLGALCGGSSVCVVAVDRLDQRKLAWELKRIALRHPRLRVVVVTDQPVWASAGDVGLPAAGIVSLPIGEAEFLRMLTCLSFEHRLLVLRSRVAECWAVPDQLRGAVWQYLRLSPRQPAADRGGLTVLQASSQAVIAKTLDTTAKTICRQANLIGLNLESTRYGWICVATAEAREFDHVEWDELSYRVGYASSSGLAGLYRRKHNLTLRQVDARPAEWFLARFEEEELGPLWMYQAREDVGCHKVVPGDVKSRAIT